MGREVLRPERCDWGYRVSGDHSSTPRLITPRQTDQQGASAAPKAVKEPSKPRPVLGVDVAMHTASPGSVWVKSQGNASLPTAELASLQVNNPATCDPPLPVILVESVSSILLSVLTRLHRVGCPSASLLVSRRLAVAVPTSLRSSSQRRCPR